MFGFELTEEQRMIRDTVHKFAEKEIRPVAAHYDETEEFPWPVVKKAVEVGVAGGDLVTGEDRSGITVLMLLEELAWGCAAITACINGTNLARLVIVAAGTDEQKKQFMPLLHSTPDDIKLGCMAITEPGAGSDVASISTTAVRDGDEYVVNGTKCFITNGGIADVHVVFATTDRSKGWAGIAPFVMLKGTPGLSMGKVEKKMGMCCSHTAEVIMEDVRVPAINRLGGGTASGKGTGAGSGLSVLKALESTRPAVGAISLGIARAAYEYALEYARERVQFGKPIAMHQAIAFKLADMAMEIDAARLLIWRAGWMARNNIPLAHGEGSMAKLYASEMAMRVTTEAVQILGGYGYMRDYPVEKWMRDAKMYEIGEGTSQIQRLVISRAIVGRLEKAGKVGT